MFISFSFHLLEIHSGKSSCFLAFSLILHHLNERKFVLFFGSCTQGTFTSSSGVLKLGSGILESGVLVSWGPANKACHPLGFNELLVVH